MPIISDLKIASLVTGLQDLHFAPVTKNDQTGFEYETPIPYAGLNTFTPSFETSDSDYQADNRTYASESGITKTTISINIAGATPEFQKAILGYTSKNLAYITAGVSGPEVLVMYKRTKNNGGAIFTAYAVCKFAPAAAGAVTKGNNFQDLVVTATVAPPINGSFGDTGEVTIDTDSPEVIASGLSAQEVETAFFTTNDLFAIGGEAVGG